MKFKKLLLIIVLSCLGCVFAQAQSNLQLGDDILANYNETDSVLTISGTGDMYEYTSRHDVPLLQTASWYSATKVIFTDGITSIANYCIYEFLKLKKVEIPEGVTRIGKNAFYLCKALEDITLPSSLKSIGADAFNYCNNAKITSLPENLEYIGESAFSGCYQLGKKISIPSKITKINDGVFNSCKSVEEILLHENIDSIMYAAFSGCNSLKTPKLPKNLKHIGISCFQGCYLIDTISLPQAITEIPEGCFNNCSSLKHVDLQGVVTSIGQFAFNYCLGLENFSVPTDVKSLGDYTFKSCRSLENITLPEGLTSLGECCFADCKALTSITLPESVNSIGELCFEKDSALSSITLLNPEVVNINANVFDKLTTSNITLYVPIGSKSTFEGASIWRNLNVREQPISGKLNDDITWEYHVSDSLMILSGSGDMPDNSDYSLWPWDTYRTAIKTINIEEGITDIGPNAFCKMPKVKSLRLPNSLTAIRNNAFSNCVSLDTVNIPYAVASIGSDAFYNDSNLVAVSLPDNLIKIDTNTFNRCVKLTKINLPSKLESISFASFYKSGLQEVSLPEKLRHLGEYAFEDCLDLERVVLSDSLKNIDNYAFSNCKALTSITAKSMNAISIQANVFSGVEISKDTLYTPIGAKTSYATADVWKDFIVYETPIIGSVGGDITWEYHVSDSMLVLNGSGDLTDYLLFDESVADTRPWKDYLNSISKVTVSEGITKIGACNFWEMKNLKEVVLPESLESIGTGAFVYCENLEELVLPENLESIESRAFVQCLKLKKINIPANVTKIEDFTFAHCGELEEILLPEKIDSIGRQAFTYCAGLRSIVLPDSLKYIGVAAFSSCDSLRLISMPEKLNAIDISAFAGCRALDTVIILHSQPIALTTDNEVFYGIDLANCTLLIPAGTTADFSAADVWKDFGTIKEMSADGTLENGISWTYTPEDGTLSFSGSGALPDHTEILMDEGDYRPWSNFRSQCTKILIGEGISKVGACSFYGFYEIKEVVFASTLDSIGIMAFSSCESLDSVQIPNSVSYIGEYAFSYCELLRAINIPTSLTKINESAFSNCESLEKLIFHEKIDSIGSNAFKDCFSLTAITLPDSLRYIGFAAFLSCEKLQLISMPEKLNAIGAGAFAECRALDSVIILHSKPIALTTNDEVFYGVTLANCTLFVPAGTAADFSTADVWKDFGTIKEMSAAGTLENGISWAYTPEDSTLSFSGSGALPDFMEIVEAGEDDEDYDFRPWKAVKDQCTKIIIGDGITKIGACDFYKFRKAKEITLPASLDSIEFGAFAACSDVESLSIPDDVSYIGGYAFVECFKLKEIEIPSKVTKIYEATFAYCASLEELPLHEKIDSIGIAAFIECAGLTTIVLPDSLRYLEEMAFASCENIDSLNLPENLAYIGEACFASCINLKAVVLNNPEPLVIEANVFAEVNLEELSLFIPGGTKAAFLAAAVWGDFGNIIEEDLNGSLEDSDISWHISFEDGVLTISGSGDMPDFSSADDRPWNDYSDIITSVIIGEDVDGIGDFTFANFSNLSEMTIEGDFNSIDENVFADVDLSEAVLTVPAGSKFDYLSDEVWSNFGSIDDGLSPTFSILSPINDTTIDERFMYVEFEFTDFELGVNSGVIAYSITNEKGNSSGFATSNPARISGLKAGVNEITFEMLYRDSATSVSDQQEKINVTYVPKPTVSDLSAHFLNADNAEITTLTIFDTEDLLLYPSVKNNGPDVADKEFGITLIANETELFNFNYDPEDIEVEDYFVIKTEFGNTLKLTLEMLEQLELSATFDLTFIVSYESDENLSNDTAVLTVTRRGPLRSDANLISLSVSEGNLMPAFDSAVTSYTLDVANEISEIRLIATANDSNAVVYGDTGTLALTVGENNFSITVTAEDGETSKTYSILVNRAEKTAIANAMANKLSIYPNPAKDIVYIESENGQTPEIKLYSLQGRLLLNSKTNRIDISQFPSGIYIIQTENSQFKIVKE